MSTSKSQEQLRVSSLGTLHLPGSWGPVGDSVNAGCFLLPSLVNGELNVEFKHTTTIYYFLFRNIIWGVFSNSTNLELGNASASYSLVS